MYEKTLWIDHIVDPENQEVIQEGTRVNANRMNKIEQGIETAHKQLSDLLQSEKTYAELETIVNNKELVPGVQYVLTDYRTKYQQPDTLIIKEVATTERLVLTAIDVDKFDRICSSLDYPQDVIWYDFNLNVCEDGSTSRNGFILRRQDESPDAQIDCPMDWRTILWARWKVNPSQYLVGDVLTDYATWTSGVPDLYAIYKVGNKLYQVFNDAIPANNVDNSVFKELWDLDDSFVRDNIVIAKAENGNNISLQKYGDTLDIQTFGYGCSRITFAETVYIINGEMSFLPNNTFGNNCHSNTFGSGCFSNTFGNSFARNTLGSGCYNNAFGNNCINNTFGSSCYNNRFGSYCVNNTFSSNCYGNTFGCSSSSSTFGSSCYNNTFGCYSSSNTFGSICYGNILVGNCYSNTFDSTCYNNTLSFGSYMNKLGTRCSSNKFGTKSRYNELGLYCLSNIFGSNCNNNIFGNACYSNNLGDNCSSNIFGTACHTNIFSNGCNHNNFGPTCYGNTFGSTCYSNVFASSCNNNTFGTACFSNTVGSSCSNNTFGNNCYNNTFASNCNSNIFGENKINLIIKYLRNKNISAISNLGSKDYTNTIERRFDGSHVYWYLNASNVPTYAVIP